jgi:xanthine dehydrogenase molybdenum-binding subunit
MSKMNIVGKSVLRSDAFDKVTGGRGYTVNMRLPGMLHAKLLRSPYPHARIRSMDTSQAEKLSGVKAVLTPGEVPQIKFHPVYFSPSTAASMIRDMLILSNTVRFAGEPVAAVAAIRPEIAEEALALIKVDYDVLPAVFDPVEAMKPGAPQIHEHALNNIAMNPSFSFGDLQRGFDEADYVFENTYRTQRVHTCYMEPRVCIVDSDTSGNLTVWSSTQHIFGLREKLAFALGIPVSKVKVVKPPYIGGGFGGKLDMGFLEPIAALLSLKAGRPVRIEHTRYEDFITTTRNPIEIYMKTGVKKDGTFTARYVKSILDTGAHATHGAVVIMVHGFFGVLLSYRCPNQKWEGMTVYTNNIIGGGFRGYGAPQAAFAVESQVDEICKKLKLDPIEFRLKNAHTEGQQHPFDPNFTLSSYRFADCLKKGAEQIGWSKRLPAGSANGTKKRGIGLGCQPLWVSGCLGFPDIYEHSGAILKLNVDGTANLSIATVDMGCGQNTVLSQIAAEELGIPLTAVKVTYADTDTVPFDAPSHASRVTYSAGNAVKAAATSAKLRVFQVASGLLNTSPENLEIVYGRVQVKDAPANGMTLADVVKRAESPCVNMVPDGMQRTPLEEKGTIMGVASLAPTSNPSPVAVEFVEVEVDTETGEVKVLRAAYAHDIGKLINPSGAEGQVEGGLQQGIGYALMENLVFEHSSGACLAADYLNYKMPTAMEMPREIKCVWVESDEPTGPFGAKSLAEPCAIVPAPAIANAIYNAIGVRIRDLPITPEKILAALGKLDPA